MICFLFCLKKVFYRKILNGNEQLYKRLNLIKNFILLVTTS